jgi:hypothetical protein
MVAFCIPAVGEVITQVQIFDPLELFFVDGMKLGSEFNVVQIDTDILQFRSQMSIKVLCVGGLVPSLCCYWEVVEHLGSGD